MQENMWSGVSDCEYRRIDFTHRQLLDLGQRSFSEAAYFQKVETLDASFNNISRLYEGCMEGLINLIVLNVSHNNIIHINSSHFQGLSKLQVLQLDHNKLSFITECMIGFISFSNKLTKLDMSFNFLSSDPSRLCNESDRSKSLKYLYLQNNNYTL